jgi:ribosomal protein S1
VLDVDVEKERISLGMKQLERGGVAKGGASGGGAGVGKNETVTVTVLEVRDGGLEVQVGDDGATGFIKRTDLGRDRDEQRPERFQVGQKFDAMVIGFDRSKKPNFSSQGAADRRGEAGGRPVRLVRFGRVARRHPRRSPQGQAGKITPFTFERGEP